MQIRSKIKTGGFLAFIFLACGALVLDSARVSATVPYITERVNLTSSGGQSVGEALEPNISQDGRFVSFMTSSSDIVANDTNNKTDIFVRDRKLGTTVRANLTSAGGELSWVVSGYKMSANGRFIIFSSSGSGIVPGDTNGKQDMFLRDLKNNTTEMVSLASTGALPNDSTRDVADISADGRYVVFSSYATNLVPNDVNSNQDVFIRDRKLGTTTMLSKSDGGTLGNDFSTNASISCDGSYVTFISGASNLVNNDTNGKVDVFLVDRVADNSVSNLTVNANGDSWLGGYADISCNGETVVFGSEASNLVVNDTNNARDLFVYNMIDGTFERVNVDPAGNETVYIPNPNNGVRPVSTNSLDYSGRYVVFSGLTTTFVSGDTNSANDIFLRDLRDGTTQIISKRNTTTQTNAGSSNPAVSLDGREVIFDSLDTGYVSGDTNSVQDIFVSKTGI